MPSFGLIKTEDKEIWAVVAFVKKLPTVSPGTIGCRLSLQQVRHRPNNSHQSLPCSSPASGNTHGVIPSELAIGDDVITTNGTVFSEMFCGPFRENHDCATPQDQIARLQMLHALRNPSQSSSRVTIAMQGSAAADRVA